MAHRTSFQFSLASLFFWTSVIAVVLGVALGAPRLYSRMQQEAWRGAWLQGQEQAVTEMGGRIIGYSKNSRLPASIDLTNTSVDCPWIKKRLSYWEYSEVRTIIVNAALVEQLDFSELEERFPDVHFVVATAYGKINAD